MSMFGTREFQDDSVEMNQSTLTISADGETNCTKHFARMYNCWRNSQELDVIYDCRSRALDVKECVGRHKQQTWVMRESIVTMRKREELRSWLRKYDEEFGHPPLLDAVDRVRKAMDSEGGVEAMHPTHFKDVDAYDTFKKNRASLP